MAYIFIIIFISKLVSNLLKNFLCIVIKKPIGILQLSDFAEKKIPSISAEVLNSKSKWHCAFWTYVFFIIIFKNQEDPIKRPKVQLNEYETGPYSIQFSQNLTCDRLLISVFPPKFTWAEPKIVLKQNRLILGSAQVNLVENTDINKQSHVKIWLNGMKYEAVSYSLSFTLVNWSTVHWRSKLWK